MNLPAALQAVWRGSSSPAILSSIEILSLGWKKVSSSWILIPQKPWQTGQSFLLSLSENWPALVFSSHPRSWRKSEPWRGKWEAGGKRIFSSWWINVCQQLVRARTLVRVGNAMYGFPVSCWVYISNINLFNLFVISHLLPRIIIQSWSFPGIAKFSHFCNCIEHSNPNIFPFQSCKVMPVSPGSNKPTALWWTQNVIST